MITKAFFLRIKLSHIIFFLQLIGWYSSYAQIEVSNFDNQIHYTKQNGLSANYVGGIIEDKQGFLWIANGNGIARFDGSSFTNYEYFNENDTDYKIGFVNSVVIDKFGKKLFIASEEGIFYTSIDTISFKKLNPFSSSNNLPIKRTNQILLENQNTLWATSHGDGLLKINIDSYEYDSFKFIDTSQNNTNQLNTIICIAKDPLNNDVLWLGTLAGLVRFNSVSKEYKVFVYNKNSDLAHNRIRKIYVSNNEVYLGTWGQGLVVFAKQNQQFMLPFKSSHPNHSLILELYKENGPNLWITTNIGLLRYDIVTNTIKSSIEHSPSKGKINGVSFVDSRGIIWFGYGKGMFKYDPSLSTHKFIQLEERSNLQDPLLIKKIIPFNDFIYVLGHNGSGLYKINATNYSFETIKIAPSDDPERTNSNLRDMVKMDDENLLILSFNKLYIYNTRTQKFHLSRLQINHPSPSLQSIVKDKSDRYWIGGRFSGLTSLDFVNNTITNYKDEFNVYKEGNHTWINTLYLDNSNKLWIAKGSSTVMDLNNSKLSLLNPNDSIPFYQDVGGFLDDNKGRVWVAGLQSGLGYITFKDFKKGISHQIDGSFRGIYKHNDSIMWTTGDGLLGAFNINTNVHKISRLNNNNQYVIGPIIHNDKGEYIIGCYNGLIIYNPESRVLNQEIPKPYIRNITGNGNIYYEERRLTNKNVSFKSGTNNLVIEVSALGFQQPEQITYSYKIQEDWVSLSASQEINITNLTHGTYNFKLKACNEIDGCSEATYNFTILTPWYKTWVAYMANVVLLISISYWFYRFKLSKKLAIAERNKLKDLNRLKSTLYTNITHEFRTPLTVILGLADTIKDDLEAQNYKTANEGMGIIERNGKDLLQLVNQLLGISKAESGTMELNLIQADVVPFLRYICESFQSLAKVSNIDLTMYFEIESLHMDFDDGKLQIIISNLLSNAIKFSHAGEKIIFHVKSETVNEDTCIVIKVKDYGVGIPENALPHIFDRFYQVENSYSKVGKGVGIGLALTQELVTLMKGTITVKSTEGKGTEFSVAIPITRNALTSTKNNTSLVKLVEDATIAQEWSLQLFDGDINLPKALIIEDNKDVAYYLKLCLQNKYHCLFANNGELGLEMAFDKIPDIIISDIMMPGRDGFEVCEILKTDARTDHIPIILLTAKTSEEDRLKGLKHGADAYLTKPFLKAELLTRLDQLILLRKRISQAFAKNKFSQILVSKENTPETKFLQKLIQIIQTNIYNPNLGSRHVAQKMGLSESQIYRKLKAITGKSTAIFIRSVRLEKAKDLIQTTDKPISEIAYEVGFNDPSWFSRAFKEEFGYTPSAMHK
ncbi:YXYXY domain-containing protein [Gelidibacter algens]|uniref:histidine kinase n=1 Tax=Gelidibacter algens TaxID=49280 RepID=A0A327S2X0_9FLAO|nr:hybrid sensor histidine kinase/response regulator transcription factor [Gelidibacter algens]RAJ23055.1 YXYXY domain-containing protein [Gelidibacter algens]